MRKKKFYIKAVYDYPERIFPLHGDPDTFSGWIERLRQERPLVLEFGAGACDFLVQQALSHPEQFFLAVEVKPDRLYKGFQKSEQLGLANIAFLQADIRQLSSYPLPKTETIYLLFSDPWPKKRHHTRRLSADAFLDIYQTLLQPDGALVIKTDSPLLFEYSLETMGARHWRISEVEANYHTPEDEQTAYEKKWRGQQKPIQYVKAFPPLRQG